VKIVLPSAAFCIKRGCFPVHEEIGPGKGPGGYLKWLFCVGKLAVSKHHFLIHVLKVVVSVCLVMVDGY
jgi:hypothetical protein